MQNIYPLFERNRILKKELLQSLRDYSFAHVQLEYQEYGQGIIRGCEVAVDGNKLVVNPGIIKYGSFICLQMEKETLSYGPVEAVQYLKIRVEVDHTCPDYILYKTELCLELNGAQKENEFEICRFHLRKGAKLRDQYTGLTDMVTEYDTINLLYASWGGLGGESISPAITKCFSEKLLEGKGSRTEDRMFAYFCLSQRGAVAPVVLVDYIGYRGGEQKIEAIERSNVYHAMCVIADQVGQDAGEIKKTAKGRHTILVD